jgi:hypothetical protein
LDENVRRKLTYGLAVEVEDERSNEVVRNLLELWLESRICCSVKEVVTIGCCNKLMRLQPTLDLMPDPFAVDRCRDHENQNVRCCKMSLDMRGTRLPIEGLWVTLIFWRAI